MGSDHVWLDAPIGYIGATKEWADQKPESRDWKAWWLNADDVTYTQFMGKDNVPFHTVLFPAMILGTREPWTMAAQTKSFNWLTYYGGKFSTSQKRGIFLDDALALFDADVWRYFLLANSPETDDTSFTWDLFAATVNKDLVGNFGNFVNRTLKLTSAQFGNQAPAGGTPSGLEDDLSRDCQSVLARYRSHFANLEFRKAVQTLRELWSLGNVYLDKRAPWSLVKTNRNEAAMVLRTAINLIQCFAIAAEPIIPFSSAKVFNAPRLTDAQRRARFGGELDLAAYEAGRGFTVPDPLFRRIEKAEVEELEQRFSGASSRME